MKVDVRITGLESAVARLSGLEKQVREAAAGALTKTAHGVNYDIKRDMQARIKGGPTSYTLRAFRVIPASPETLAAAVALRDDSPAKGTVWAKALAHLFTGGSRSWKRMEGAFRAARILPSGYMLVPAAKSWAMPLDAYGNPPRSLIVQLISYFKAFGEQGYRANMTDKRRAKLAARGVTASGYKVVNGVEYFISYGRRGRPGGDRFVHGRFDQHLPAGIWARRGIHGRDVAPVFLFVRGGSYRPMFSLSEISQRTVSRVFRRNFDAALPAALRTAK